MSFSIESKVTGLVIAVVVAVVVSICWYVVPSDEKIRESEISMENLATSWATGMGLTPKKASCVRYSGGLYKCSLAVEKAGETQLLPLDCYGFRNSCRIVSKGE